MLRAQEPPEPRAGAAAAEESGAGRLTPPPGQQIRSDTSETLDKTIPFIKDKVMEMSHIYAKDDKLEAFVKMVAHLVSFLEEQVLEEEKSRGTFLNTVCKLFQWVTVSSFKNRHPLAAARSYDLPKLPN